MFSLTIHFGPNAMVWSFLFKDEKRAKEQTNALRECIKLKVGCEIKDTFGQEAFIELPVHGVLLEDLEQVMEARIYRSLDNARGEIKAKQRAMSDPVMRTAQQGPGVISPNFGRN